MTKRYINVAYEDRDMAKRLGARWDPSVKRWYCPPGSALAKAYSWRKAPATVAASIPTSAPPSVRASAPRPMSLSAQILVPQGAKPQGGEQLSFLG